MLFHKKSDKLLVCKDLGRTPTHIVHNFPHPHACECTKLLLISHTNPHTIAATHTNSLQSNLIWHTITMFNYKWASSWAPNKQACSFINFWKKDPSFPFIHVINLPFLDRIKSNCSKLSKVATNISKNWLWASVGLDNILLKESLTSFINSSKSSCSIFKPKIGRTKQL